MKNIILASSSPRRKQILKEAGIVFRVVPSCYKENLSSLDFSKEKIEYIAKQKALDVAQKYPNDIILSADTVVVLNNKIFTKPKDEKHAFAMLRSLSGKTHFVQTSICIIYKDKIFIKSTKTNVTFNNLSNDEIYAYIRLFNPLDKAGAYGIQEVPENFIKCIDGDIQNVIGISSSVVKEMLQYVYKIG